MSVSGQSEGLGQVEQLAEEVAVAHGLRLYDVELLTVRGQAVLRVTLDKPGGREPGQGVTVKECVDVSRELGQILDADDPLPGAYRLEVSSPGVERSLSLGRHFELAVGERLWLAMEPDVEGPREYQGLLESYDAQGESLTIRLAPRSKKKLKKGQRPKAVPVAQWEKVEVSLSSVRKARTVYEFK